MFTHHSYKGNNFCDFLLTSLDNSPSKMGSSLKVKNLLQGEQILFFKSKPSSKRGEMIQISFNPTALRTAKTPQSFGCSECNRVKEYQLPIRLPFLFCFVI